MADDPIRARAHKLLARGAHADAVEQFRRIIRLPGVTADDYACLAQALTATGRLKEAEVALRAAIALVPGAADLHACLGQVMVQSGQRVPAVASFETALKLDRSHWAAADLVAVKAQITESVHSWHLPMLGDHARNAAFATAIAAAVRPDDVVLDIGTGSGLLAMMAARAGARHVYACEMLPDLAALARIVVAQNGFADRITIIAKPSAELVVGVDLPERASLLVTEIFDALLIGEGALPAIHHARQHLLTPDARIIPAGGTVSGQLVSFPRLKPLFPLTTLCGFDMRAFAAHALDKQFYPIVAETEQIERLSAPSVILDVDFLAPIVTERRWTCTLEAQQSGVAQALLLWLDLRLDGDTMLSSGPGGAARHWNPVAFLLDQERAVVPGERVEIGCRMGANVLHFST